MSWAVGYDITWRRDVGYGVLAYCDYPDCNEEIDRGLANVCGAEPFGVITGCGLYFCQKHLSCIGQLCVRCRMGVEPFTPKPDHPAWVNHKATDPSWRAWRESN